MTHQDVPAPLGDRDESYTHTGMEIRTGFRPESRPYHHDGLPYVDSKTSRWALGFSVLLVIFIAAVVFGHGALPTVVSR